MLCVTDQPVAGVQTRTCTKCGLIKSAGRFAPDPGHAGGLDVHCRDCRSSSGRARRAARRSARRSARQPDVLTPLDGEGLSTAVLGALRRHYDGRPGLLLRDLRESLSQADPVVRTQAALTLLALREIADLARQVSLREDPLAALAELPDSERVALARKLVPAGWTVAPPD